jgi:rhodanese-related sulfurtransferase
MILWSMFGSKMRGITDIDTNGALQMINHKNAFILDVRQPEEYKSGHIINATLIPLGSLSSRISELAKYKNKPVIVVCRSGNRSGSACAILAKEGFTEAYNLSGGMMAWQRANLPTRK